MAELAINFVRKLKFRRGAEIHDGQLQIVGVKQMSNGRWGCELSMSFLHEHPTTYKGDDPLDALQTCMTFLRDFLKLSAEDGVIVWWRYEGDNGGF